MKKILLSCGASLCLLVADAQLLLNEFYVRPNPNQNHQEYFELYNSGMAVENTDCYSLVTFFEQNGEVGFYVVDMPAGTVNGRDYYVGSSQAPAFQYQSGTGTADMSWNAGNIYRYVYRSGALVMDNTGAPYNDIFIKSDGTSGNNGVYAMFLFKSGNLVDAFLGNHTSIDVPSYIEQMGQLSHVNGCSSISYNFATIDGEPDSKFGHVNAEAGTDNGYHRVPTSVCGGVGNWEKTSAPQEHTPNAVNHEQGGGNGGNSGSTGSLSFMLECTNSTTISYNITSGPSDAFPVNVAAYHDANGSRTLDSGDVVIGTQTDASASDPQKSFARTSSMEEFIFVFDAAGNCYDTLAPLNCPAGIVLPVTMKSFQVKRDRGNVSVNWTTATEQNNRGFNIQRNTGGSWETVGFVRSSALNGSSSGDISYSYSDINSFRGVSQYRLQQVDLDGKSTYSEIRTVRGEQQGGKTLVYPNPTRNGIVKLIFESLNSKRDIFVSDMSGRIVKQWRGVTSDNLEITNLDPGMYMIRVVDQEAGTSTSDKLVVSGR